jgi:hypothetical protein
MTGSHRSRSSAAALRRIALLEVFGPSSARVLDQLIEAHVHAALEAAGTPRILLPEEAGERLGISADAGEKRLREGKLPGWKSDGRWYVDGEATDRHIRDTSRSGEDAAS